MALDKTLFFVNKETGEHFYLQRLTSRTRALGQRKVIAVGFSRNNNKAEINPDELFGPDAKWEYRGGRVFEA